MLLVRVFAVHSDKVDLLRDWGHELERRRREVVETFTNETVRHELALLLQPAKGPLLIHAMEAADLDEARRAVEEHPLPIDLEHRAVMSEVLAERVDLEVVYDIAANADHLGNT
jgi:hypothetical protein